MVLHKAAQYKHCLFQRNKAAGHRETEINITAHGNTFSCLSELSNMTHCTFNSTKAARYVSVRIAQYMQNSFTTRP